MRFYPLIFLGCVALAISAPASVLAQNDHQATFIVSADLKIESGNAGDIGIVTGRPLGVMSPGSCQSGGEFPVQQVIFVHPRAGHSIVAPVIMLSLEPLSAGTRLTELSSLGSCLGAGDVLYNKYRANFE